MKRQQISLQQFLREGYALSVKHKKIAAVIIAGELIGLNILLHHLFEVFAEKGNQVTITDFLLKFLG